MQQNSKKMQKKRRWDGVGYYQRLSMECVLRNMKTPEEQAAYRQKIQERYNNVRFFNADKAKKYIEKETRLWTKCINYTIFFDHQPYIELKWAVKQNIPSCLWFGKNSKEVVFLTPVGLTWILRYLLKRDRVLVARDVRYPQSQNP